MLPIIIAAKAGIKSCRLTIECVLWVHTSMWLATQLEMCLHEQTQVVASAACRVGNQQFHSYVDIASLLLVSLLYIVIPTILFISSMFTFYCTMGPPLSALKLETLRLYNLIVHVSCLLFQLRCFVFIP